LLYTLVTFNDTSITPSPSHQYRHQKKIQGQSSRSKAQCLQPPMTLGLTLHI